MINRIGSTRSLLRFLPLAVGVLLVQFYFWNDTTDDAYILFRYIARFHAGLGLTFNNGERVEGYSSPLWTLLLVALSGLGSLHVLTHVLGLLLALAALYFVFRICSAFRFSDSQILLAGLFFLLTPGFYYFAGAGLEGPLLQLLLLAAVYLAVTRGSLALVMGLIGITRPEGILYLLAWAIWSYRTDRKRFLLKAFIAILPTIGWEIFRLAYYGDWLPNTAYAKPWHGFGLRGFLYLGRFAVPVAIAFAAAILYRIKTDRSTYRELELPIYFVVCATLFVLYAQGDWMFFGRFVTPIMPIVGICLAAMFAHATRKQYLITVAAVAIAQVLCWFTPMRRFTRDEGYATVMKGREQLATGAWIADHYPQGTTLATGRLGGVSYGALGLTVWDQQGLTDRAEAHYIARKVTGADPVLARKPELILENGDTTEPNYKQNAKYFASLSEHYEYIRSFRQGATGYFDLWRLKK